MFETPADALYVWVGLSLASLAAVGVAVQLPTTAPPDAAGLADTVDAVAASDHPATAEYHTRADRVRVGTDRVWLRNDGGRTAATLVGDAVPARTDRLRDVLHGADPERLYESRAAFETALREAREADPQWRHTDGTVVVRRVYWGDRGVTLVG